MDTNQEGFVIDRHGGAVDVESVVGRGTVFKLTIPVAQPGTPPPAGGGAGAAGPQHIG